MASTYVKMVLGEDDSILVLDGFDIQSLRRALIALKKGRVNESRF